MTDIFANVAVSSTNTYKSKVTRDANAGAFYVQAPTGTAVGVTSREVNFLSKEAYELAIGAVQGESAAAREAKEAANTTGWVTQSFLNSNVVNSGATLAVSSATTSTAQMPAGPERHRCSYTNSSGTGNLRVFLRLIYGQ